MTLAEKLQSMATGPAAREPATQDEIQLIEAELGFELPADYAEFMLRSNGFEIDVDPVVQHAFRLAPVTTIIDETHGYGHDVRDEQIVIIGSDGVDNAFAIDFKTDPAQFVMINHYGSGRSSFIYLGETLEQFVEHVLAGTRLKKPKGLAKRKKAKQRPDKVDQTRKQDDPGLAMVLKGYRCETLNPFGYVAERKEFLFNSSEGAFSLDPETGQTQPLPAAIKQLHMPVLFDELHNAYIGQCFDHEVRKLVLRAFDVETGEPILTYACDPLEHPQSLQFTPDGTRLIAVFDDKITDNETFPGLCLFDRKTGELVERFLSWRGNASGITITQDGMLVHGQMILDGEKLPCPVHHEIVHRSLDTGEIVKTIRLPDSFYTYFWLRITRGGRLFGIRQDFVVCEIHEDGSVTQPFGLRRVAEWNSMELVGDDRLLLGTGAGTLHLLDIETGNQIWSVRHRRGSCSTLAVSSDNKWLLTGIEGPPRLWRLPD